MDNKEARIERARQLGLKNRKHGQAATSNRGPSYRSWECARSRCSNPKDPSFSDYGGRGITFDKTWDDFQVFLVDMGERPRGMTLDRIDVNGNYTPKNWRWADAKTQGRNKRSNRMVNFGGNMLPLVDVAEATGVPYQRLHERIVRRGWSVDDAINKPPRKW